MIPVLDWSRFTSGKDRDGFVKDLGNACRDTGFFLVSGHGIPQSLINDAFKAADDFFALPTEVKAASECEAIENGSRRAAQLFDSVEQVLPDPDELVTLLGGLDRREFVDVRAHHESALLAGPDDQPARRVGFHCRQQFLELAEHLLG